MVTDRVLQGPHVLWGIEDLSLPNVTSSEVNRTREEQEIRESLSRRAPQVDSNESGDDKLSFLAKFFELQVCVCVCCDCAHACETVLMQMYVYV